MSIVISGVSRDSAFDGALDSLLDASFASRLFGRDASLWGEAAAAEAAVRLGWTDFAANAERVLAEAEALAEDFRTAGVDRFVLCGMGGSSLAPLVIAPELTVLDSTHPDAVRNALEGDLSRTAVIVSSKSGGTVETLSHLAAFEAAFFGAGIDAADRIVVVTDPGSQLESEASASGKRIFLADPNVGGRFSALTAFGIVPSVLAGADMRRVVRDAAEARSALSVDTGANPALLLAAAIASGVPDRFLLEMHPDGSLPEAFGLWVEQLVAESTGKDGRGVLPIALRKGAKGSEAASTVPVGYGVAPSLFLEGDGSRAEPLRLGVGVGVHGLARAGLGVAGELGEQLLLWQVVTAALGFLIGVDPFNQPDVEAAKAATRETLGAPVTASAPRLSPAVARAQLVSAAPEGGYVGIQAYLDSSLEGLDDLLEKVRVSLSSEMGLPVSVGYGPRYLHSTGQFHKGGPGQAAFLQIIGRAGRDVSIPGNELGFDALMAAQALGDAAVLRSRGRTVVSVETNAPVEFLRELLGGEPVARSRHR